MKRWIESNDLSCVNVKVFKKNGSRAYGATKYFLLLPLRLVPLSSLHGLDNDDTLRCKKCTVYSVD